MLSRAVRHWAGRPHARAFSTAAVVAEATGRRALLAVPAGLGAAAVASLDDPGYFVYSMGAIPMRLGRDVLAAGTTLIGVPNALGRGRGLGLGALQHLHPPRPACSPGPGHCTAGSALTRAVKLLSGRSLAHPADYKFSLRGLEGGAYAAALHDCHERGAARLVDLCFANGGIYSECVCVRVCCGRGELGQQRTTHADQITHTPSPRRLACRRAHACVPSDRVGACVVACPECDPSPTASTPTPQ